jgi:hypothetical protein
LCEYIKPWSYSYLNRNPCHAKFILSLLGKPPKISSKNNAKILLSRVVKTEEFENEWTKNRCPKQ